MSKKVATEFEKIIHADRQRKHKEALAAKIFNKDRRSSAPTKGASPAPSGGSLASRAGVKKQQQAQRVSSVNGRPIPTGPAAGNSVNGVWTHDLHDGASSRAGSLVSRITTPGAASANQQAQKRLIQQQQRRAQKLASAIVRDQQRAPAEQHANVTTRSAAAAAVRAGTAAGNIGGFSIRGLAGPPVVMAQNFAPGTTAADIESAVTPVGGIVTSCRLLKTQPIIIAEIIFEDPNGAQRVIDTFNNQTADGRKLHVYLKAGGGAPPAAPTGPAADRAAPSAVRNGISNGNVVDGSLGFYIDDGSMDVDGDRAEGANGGRLYSDALITSNINFTNGNSASSRRGPGYNRGGRVRNLVGR